MFSLIVCTDTEGGIGLRGDIPWKHSLDMYRFKKITTGNIVIMGRKTWDSLPDEYKPLPDRINVVISHSGQGEHWYSSIVECCVDLARNKIYRGKEKFIVGGAEIYQFFLDHNLVKKIYHTHIPHDFGCDVKIHLPDIWVAIGGKSGQWSGTLHNPMIYDTVDRQSGERYMSSYRQFTYNNHEEKSYLSLLKKIFTTGETRGDRTGTGTISIFAPGELEFDLSNNCFPLLTTRSMNLRLIFEELMFFLRGQTDNNILVARGVKIWSPNTTREFLDSRGLEHYEEGDMGGTYGFLFRHFGASYVNCSTDYDGQGCDQLMEVIRLLKEEPTSRRIIISLWDPANASKMALPACAFMYQFHVSYVDNVGFLNCKLTQRSSDISLAGGWNIATASLLTIMLARMCGLKPKKIIWSTGDTHIYLNQIEGVKEQLTRTPRNFPCLFFAPDAPSLDQGYITDFKFDDLRLVGYQPHPAIKIAMNV